MEQQQGKGMKKLGDIERDIENYTDIINYKYCGSKKYPKMPINDRAFQFAPFDALAGYMDLIDEKSKFLEDKIILDEFEDSKINEKFKLLKDNLRYKPVVTITFFYSISDNDKGEYKDIVGVIKRIDYISKQLIFSDGTKIEFKNIIDIRGELFDKL